jgi:hypothetical protein
MWKLRGRDNKIKRWSEYGDFQNIADAAKRILELEGDPHAALFLGVYVDPNPLTGLTADAEILSRLEYRSEKGFYLLDAHRFIKGRFRASLSRSLPLSFHPCEL